MSELIHTRMRAMTHRQTTVINKEVIYVKAFLVQLPRT